MSRRAGPLETVSVVVPEAAVEPFEAAIAAVCGTVGLFEEDDAGTLWRIEGVRPAGEQEVRLQTGLALAAAATGVRPTLARMPVAAEGWLARTEASFPEQFIGRRFVVRGTHLPPAPAPAGRIVLTLDAGLAFGSGEHGSTRGCLRALEAVAHRRPRRVLDLGTGSGVLAMAASRLLHRRVLATDIEPWSVRVAAENAAANFVASRVRCIRADGWRTRRTREGGPYDLVLANILAGPLAGMASDLAANLAPGGRAVLAGLLRSQIRRVLAAHRRQGLVLSRVLLEGDWATLVLRKPA